MDLSNAQYSMIMKKLKQSRNLMVGCTILFGFIFSLVLIDSINSMSVLSDILVELVLIALFLVLFIFCIIKYNKLIHLFRSGLYDIVTDVVVGKKTHKSYYQFKLSAKNAYVECPRQLYREVIVGDAVYYIDIDNFVFAFAKAS